jgi:hypothetical protein
MRGHFFKSEHCPYLVPMFNLKSTDQCTASICYATNYITNLSQVVEILTRNVIQDDPSKVN